MITNLIQFFLERTKDCLDATAVVDGDQRLTFSELRTAETKIADWLVTTYYTTRRPIAVFLPKSITFDSYE